MLIGGVAPKLKLGAKVFHERNNLFFGRKADGSVRILKFNSKRPANAEWPQVDKEYSDAEFDVTIPGHGWCSVIASVSALGEEGGRFCTAKEFHGIA